MTPGQIGGLAGGIVGAVIGLAGGAYGTYCSIKNTNGPRERAFMIRSSVICWILISLFLLLLFVFPSPYKWFLWIPYGILLPLGIIYGNRRQQQIRQEEASQ
jgi:hypothetical protein